MSERSDVLEIQQTVEVELTDEIPLSEVDRERMDGDVDEWLDEALVEVRQAVKEKFVNEYTVSFDIDVDGSAEVVEK